MLIPKDGDVRTNLDSPYLMDKEVETCGSGRSKRPSIYPWQREKVFSQRIVKLILNPKLKELR